jgi:RHS repeat-associated protein
LVKVWHTEDFLHADLTVDFSYDPFDRRIAKFVTEGDVYGEYGVDYTTRSEFYVYDRGNVLLDYVDQDGSAGTESDPTLARRYLYGPLVDQVLAQEDYDLETGASQGTNWMFADNLGTVRDLVDDSGDVIEHYKYSGFGELLAVTDGADDPTVATTRYLYTGREWDTDVDLQYNRLRWYNPAIGRWMSEDPIPDDFNPYRYVRNSATNATDPSGLINFLGSLITLANGESARATELDLKLAELRTKQAEKSNDPFALSKEFRKIQMTGAQTAKEDIGALATGAIHFNAAAFGGGFIGPSAASSIRTTFGHGARHLAGTGLSESAVEGAINAQIQAAAAAGSKFSGGFWGRIVVGGRTIEYRAFTLPNGTINIGTYYIP